MLLYFLVRLGRWAITDVIRNNTQLLWCALEDERIVSGKRGQTAQGHDKPRSVFRLQDFCTRISPMVEIPPLREDCRTEQLGIRHLINDAL